MAEQRWDRQRIILPLRRRGRFDIVGTKQVARLCSNVTDFCFHHYKIKIILVLWMHISRRGPWVSSGLG